MVGWHHQFNGCELGQTPGDGEGQRIRHVAVHRFVRSRTWLGNWTTRTTKASHWREYIASLDTAVLPDNMRNSDRKEYQGRVAQNTRMWQDVLLRLQDVTIEVIWSTPNFIPMSLLKHFPPSIANVWEEISCLNPLKLIFSSVYSFSHVRLFATPWTAAHQALLSITISRRSLRLTSIESVMPSSHLILGRPLLLPPIPPSIRVFSNESTLLMR